tara:strand:- start:29 stop:331 length:303 start_codon:yes stop_codon:yes gene_type:complete
MSVTAAARIKYFGRPWCKHCQDFDGTWESIRALAGSANARKFVSDFKGFSPVGYYPSFTVGGDAKLGEQFGSIMRNYKKPVRIFFTCVASNQDSNLKSMY